MKLLSVFLIGLAFVMVAKTDLVATPLFATETIGVLVAPKEGEKQVATISAETVVEVSHQANGYWRVELQDGKSGYVKADALQQVKTKGGPLVPIIVMAGAPVAKVVITKAIGWFKKLFSISAKQADQVLGIGQELFVLAQKSGMLKVQLPDGAVGWIKQGPEIVELKPVSYAGKQETRIWKDSQPIPQSATGLTLQVQVRMTDGTPVPPGGTLTLGDEYRIYITPSADCYVRITCETPDRGYACQYYPSQFPGFQTSGHFKAGQTYATELLPSGANFKVSEPIGAKDILRIEANTYAPYHYVQSTDGCKPTGEFRGGGFSIANNVKNPTPQIVLEYELGSSK